MKKLISVVLAFALLFALSAQAEQLTGEAEGFGGPVQVTVTVEDGRIVTLDIQGEKETPGIGSNAIEQLPLRIIEANGIQVDVVAGATVTSEAIIKAVETALSVTSAPAGEAPKGETLTGEAEGFGGPVTVTITRDGDKIVALQIVGDSETPGIGTNAIEQLPEKIKEAGSAQVDVIAGATVTSEAIIKAVEAALSSAVTAGGTLTGEAQGFGGPVTVTITKDGDKIVDVQIVGDSETPGIGTNAIEQLPEKIKEAGNAEVDVISGATVTSEAILEAVRKALGEEK